MNYSPINQKMAFNVKVILYTEKFTNDQEITGK